MYGERFLQSIGRFGNYPKIAVGLTLLIGGATLFWGSWADIWKSSSDYSHGSWDDGDSGFIEEKRTCSFDLVTKKNNVVSLVIIGSGPAGLMAAVYGARACRDTLVIEGNKPGGLLMDTTEVANWPGEIAIDGPNIIDGMRNQAKKLGAHFMYDAIESVDFRQWPYRIKTENGVQLTALSVIVATGATPKRLGIPGEDANWGMGVSSCAVCDAPFFKEKNVIVVGGGDSAVEEAIQLAPFAKEITIMVRSGAMRAAATMQERLHSYPSIKVLYNVELREVVSDVKGVTGARVFYRDKNKIEYKAIDGIFLAIGHEPNTMLFKDFLSVDSDGFIRTKGRSQKTSIPGVFAAGDVEDKIYRQAGVAAGSGIKAALDADSFLTAHGITQQKIVTLGESLYCERFYEKKDAVPLITTPEQFDAFNAAHDTAVIVCFITKTCTVCAQMAPMIEEMAHELKNVSFIFVDTDASPSLAARYFVQKVPCVMVFQKGAILGRYNSGMSKKELSQFIEVYMS